MNHTWQPLSKKQFLKQYFWAIEDAHRIHDFTELKHLQVTHPDWFKDIQKSQRARKRLGDLTRYMLYLDLPIYWVTLTYKNIKDKNTQRYKREEAVSFLKKISDSYIYVEEFGEEHDRYHIHAFVQLKDGKTYDDLRKWHSRNKILLLDKTIVKKKIRYLTKYLEKQAPRVNCSRSLSRGLLSIKNIKEKPVDLKDFADSLPLPF